MCGGREDEEAKDEEGLFLAKTVLFA